MNGKSKCKLLKEIRRRIAEENDIAYITSECKHKGDCLGTCPKCEAELRYLENELEKRRAAGKSVAVAGLAIAATLSMTSCSPENLTDPLSLIISPTQGDMGIELDGDVMIFPSVEELFVLPAEEQNDYVAMFHRADFQSAWSDYHVSSGDGWERYSVMYEDVHYYITISYDENGRAKSVMIEEDPDVLTGFLDTSALLKPRRNTDKPKKDPTL